MHPRKHALGQLPRSPALALAVVGSFALGIGANAATFTASMASVELQARSKRTALPDNPCELLSQGEMSAITQLTITAVHHIPREFTTGAEAGTLCDYQTQSDFGSIYLQVPSAESRAADPKWGYWAVRAQCFDRSPKNCEAIANLGQDAWLGGRTALFVLVRPNEHFRVSSQNSGRQWIPVAMRIARAILDQF